MLNEHDIKTVEEFNDEANQLDLDKKYLNLHQAHQAILKGDIEGLKD